METREDTEKTEAGLITKFGLPTTAAPPLYSDWNAIGYSVVGEAEQFSSSMSFSTESHNIYIAHCASSFEITLFGVMITRSWKPTPKLLIIHLRALDSVVAIEMRKRDGAGLARRVESPDVASRQGSGLYDLPHASAVAVVEDVPVPVQQRRKPAPLPLPRIPTSSNVTMKTNGGGVGGVGGDAVPALLAGEAKAEEGRRSGTGPEPTLLERRRCRWRGRRKGWSASSPTEVSVEADYWKSQTQSGKAFKSISGKLQNPHPKGINSIF
ncbi:hypothetical protein B0H14DRAFT_2602476 [Mycena olivaceomarginata]|nr:hypothetical protein B0H14DRAFT_2602476 [Mycena olivaceomarginata]